MDRTKSAIDFILSAKDVWRREGPGGKALIGPKRGRCPNEGQACFCTGACRGDRQPGDGLISTIIEPGQSHIDKQLAHDGKFQDVANKVMRGRQKITPTKTDGTGEVMKVISE